MGKINITRDHAELTNQIIQQDTSSNVPLPITDASGVACAYCLLCDEVINQTQLCKHQGIRIEKFLEKYVKEVNNDIKNKQKEARSIQFYLATTRAGAAGRKVEPFHMLNIYGFKNFVVSHFIEN